jgi:hypothetical protein
MAIGGHVGGWTVSVLIGANGRQLLLMNIH